MGTEAYREAKRFTGMGCRTSAADEPTPDRPFRRPGEKDLIDRVGFPPSLTSSPGFTNFYFILPLDLCYNNSNVHDKFTNLTNTRHSFKFLNRHASRVACVNPRTERTTLPSPSPSPGRPDMHASKSNLSNFNDSARAIMLQMTSLTVLRYAPRIPLIAPLLFLYSISSI